MNFQYNFLPKTKSSIRSRKSTCSGVVSHRNVIRLTYKNVEMVRSLWDNCEQSRVKEIFGEVNVEEILSKSWLSIGLQIQPDELLAVVCLGNYPNIPAVPPWDWEYWIKKLYHLKSFDCTNTVWVHLLMWLPSHYHLFMKPMMQYLFNMRDAIGNVALYIPPMNSPLDFLGFMGTVIRPFVKSSSFCNILQSLYLIPREKFVATYTVRKAVEEDNDHLVPLIETCAPNLTKMYGEYYIAEILSKHINEREIIVVEKDRVIVGVACLTPTINYDVLNKEFDLLLFNGFKKPHDGDTWIPDVLQEMDSDENLKINEESMMAAQPIYLDNKFDNDSQDTLTSISKSASDYSLVFTHDSIFYFAEDYEEQLVEEENFDEYTDYRKRKEFASLGDMSDIGISNLLDNMKENIPIFKGSPNAFVLEIFVVDQAHEVCTPTILDATFEVFPDRDYCLISAPSESYMDLLSHYFCKVSPRPEGTFKDELYFLHKNVLRGKMSIELANELHSKKVKTLLSTIPSSGIIWQQFDNYLKDNKSIYTAIVILHEYEVIGVAIVTEEMDVGYIKNNYDLYPLNIHHYKSSTHGIIEALVISPIFETHSKWVMREIHRLSQFDVLYYKLKQGRPFNNLFPSFIQVTPLMLPDCNIPDVDEINGHLDINESDFTNKENFALYLSTMATCLRKKHNINKRIVIDGWTTVTIGFLFSLFFPQDLLNSVIYTNITVICHNCVTNSQMNTTYIRDAFMIKKYFVDQRFFDMINLKGLINMVKARPVSLDRSNQIVVLRDNRFLNYDLFFIFSGEKFYMPNEMTLITPERPLNVFLINNAINADSSLRTLKNLINNYNYNDYKVIVYGNYLEAYTAINGLLMFGIRSKNLVFVEPFPLYEHTQDLHQVSLFNDQLIDGAVKDHIKAEGIKIYSSYSLCNWDYDENHKMITTVSFESKHHMLKLDCLAIYLFAEKGVSSRIVNFVNKSGLVFDGRLVINKRFQTNDERIYAAGTITKYGRRYYAKFLIHKYFNKLEIGQNLGKRIRNKLLPQTLHRYTINDGWNFCIDRGDSLVPKFEKPKMKYCILPGGLYYFSVTPPGIRIPIETAINRGTFSHLLLTGNVNQLDTQGIFQIQLSSYNQVHNITCLAEFPIIYKDLYHIWGKHERLLNSLLPRFECGQITNLFNYFKEPWAYAIYHSSFNKLITSLNYLISSNMDVDGWCVSTDVIEMYKKYKWKSLPVEEQEKLEESFMKSGYKKLIEDQVVSFIKENLCLWRVYAIPPIVRHLLRDYQDSPMFRN